MRKIKNLFAVSAMLVITLFSSCEKEESKPKTGEFNLVVDGETFAGVGVVFSVKDDYFYSIKIEDGIDFKMYIERDTLDSMTFPGKINYSDKDIVNDVSTNILTTSINLDNKTYPWGLGSRSGDVNFLSKNEIELINCTFRKFNVETNEYKENVIVSGTLKF